MFFFHLHVVRSFNLCAVNEIRLDNEHNVGDTAHNFPKKNFQSFAPYVLSFSIFFSLRRPDCDTLHIVLNDSDISEMAPSSVLCERKQIHAHTNRTKLNGADSFIFPSFIRSSPSSAAIAIKRNRQSFAAGKQEEMMRRDETWTTTKTDTFTLTTMRNKRTHNADSGRE